MPVLRCRVCNATEFDLVIDLGDQPWGNGFRPPETISEEKSYPLRLMLCKKCSTAQLDFTVPKEEMFVDHTYLSGVTKTLEKHFFETAKKVKELFCMELESPKVLDIGSNDGKQLEQYQKLGFEILGVESAKYVSEVAVKNGIPTINDFFNFELARTIDKKFDVINASGVFFHLEELHSVCKGIKFLLNENGVFVVQFIYMKLMQENIAFDQIYHEHLLYYTLKTINQLLEMHNLEIFDAYVSPIHGGSIIAYVGHPSKHQKTSNLQKLIDEEDSSKSNSLNRYQVFASDIVKAKERTQNWVKERLKIGKTIYGLGAPVKGNTLLNYFNLGPSEIKYLTERNPLRKGLVSPGKHIPVILDHELPALPDAYLVLAWNFKKEILERHREDIKNGIEFFFPVEPKETA